MKLFGKDKPLYKLTEREQGYLEAFAAQRAIADASYQKVLQDIMKRENIPTTEDVVFDPKRMAFVKVKK